MPTPERSLRVEAVVLHHIDWGEADRLLTLFTRELGRVRAVAKGVRKSRSRKAGHLEPFTRSNLQLARGRDLFIITQAEAIETYTALKDDLIYLGYASYLVELLTRFTYEEGENRSLYRLLVNSLNRLNRQEDPAKVVHYYEIRLLDLVGYRPRLFSCAQCEKDIQPEDQFFSAPKGGVLCPQCGNHSPDGKPIHMQALKVLRHYQRSNYQDALRIHVDPATNAEIELVMQYYLTHLLERRLNSPSFIHRMKRERSIPPESEQKTQPSDKIKP